MKTRSGKTYVIPSSEKNKETIVRRYPFGTILFEFNGKYYLRFDEGVTWNAKTDDSGEWVFGSWAGVWNGKTLDTSAPYPYDDTVCDDPECNCVLPMTDAKKEELKKMDYMAVLQNYDEPY